MINLQPNRKYDLTSIDCKIYQVLNNHIKSYESIVESSDTIMKSVFKLEYSCFSEVKNMMYKITKEEIEEINKQISIKLLQQ